VASGEWEGRAGGYAIQGLGAGLVSRIEGDYLNVVGLPAALLIHLLADRLPGTYGFG
jgi:septum formation protein